MKRLFIFSFFQLLLSWGLLAQNAIAPLFPVSVTHEFSEPKKTFEDVQALILANYYSPDITEKDLYWAAIQGMLRHISPPEIPELAKIWTPEEYEDILNSLKGVKLSLGFNSTFNTNDGSITVTDVLEDSPAVGQLQLYDRIVRINGESLKGKTLSFVNNLLDGPSESEVSLTVIRDINVVDIKLRRTAFPSNDLKVTVIPGRNMALVEIKNVSQGLTQQLSSELQKLQQQQVKKILLDLRNNPGGVLNEGVNIANLFLSKNNIIVRTVTRSDKATPIVADMEEPFGFELMVMVNKNTASAAEIIAAALQDHKRATVIGTKTFGKGVIETTYTLENQYRVKFISSAMYSPAGRTWQATGVLPDFLVQQDPSVSATMAKLPIEQRAKDDIYILTAIKLLQ